MLKKLLKPIFLLVTVVAFSQTNKVSVVKDESGMKLVVDGKDFMVNGMNWDYIPIGTNTVNANFWKKSDDIIKAGLDSEMSLLRNMGVNVVRLYTGVPAKWIQFIYENYGIYTILNHSFGRYGLTLNGVWTPTTIYDDETTMKTLLSEMDDLVKGYKDTPGLLMYLLGNENNYGLFFKGAETENFPDDNARRKFIGEKRGRPMYKLMNDAAKQMKAMDASHPIAICNGDVLFLDIVAEECKDVDIYGTNVYRGVSFGTIFQEVKDKLNKPIMFTEFGADAFNAIANKEDQYSQAYYMVGNWKEIYENAAGMGKANNSLGGCTFQFSDGWWKFDFDDRANADVHDNDAGWSNGGYYRDFEGEGINNMNEEWFGICAKGQTDSRGLYELFPRAAYYAIKEAHQLNPYAQGMDLNSVKNHFDNINIADAVLRARGDKAALNSQQGGILRISTLQARFSSFSTGGNLTTTPRTADPENTTTFPDQLGFDNLESYFIGVEANPAPNVSAEVIANITGNIAGNPIDEIFYENRARPITVNSPDGNIILEDNNRLAIYQAKFDWKAKHFDVRGFFRTGHYHWAYEGDFFNFYQEANYGPNLDIYNGITLGVEIDGKRALKGFKAAIGPAISWGANPSMIYKYRTKYKELGITGIYQRDFEQAIELDDSGSRVLDPAQTLSGIIPPFPQERASLVLERKFKKFGVQVGGIWAGSPVNGFAFQDVRGEGDERVIFQDQIQSKDNWGGKIKVTYEGGKFNWYAQAAAQGIVASGSYDQTQTFTGWRLKDSGSGNQTNFLTGFAYRTGNFVIAPNFLWQEPIVDPIPNDIAGPGRLRNVIDDPFAVRAGNRRTTAGEILLTFDPTPGSFFYAYDNDKAEDAKFAANLGFVYRHLPTTQDAGVGFLANRQFFAFGASAPARDLWEANSRMVFKPTADLGIIANLLYGRAQANGDSERLVRRFSGDVRMLYKNIKVQYVQKVNDYGPFDFHRDFNLTFPWQSILNISTTVGKADWFILPSTEIGIRGTYRTLNEFSPRYLPTAQVAAATLAGEPAPDISGFGFGNEWEIMTYIYINIGK